MLINTSRIHIVLHSSSDAVARPLFCFLASDPILISFVCNMGVKKTDSTHTHTSIFIQVVCMLFWFYFGSGEFLFLVFFFCGLQTV